MMDRDIDIRSERTDDTGFGGIRVIQRPGFGYGVDSVLLAAFAAGETGARPVRPGYRITDLGTGCGIIAFILAHKVRDTSLTGYEVRRDAADRAVRACRMNGLEDRVSFICSDICDITGKHDQDAVVTNPPYFIRDGRNENRTDDRYIARHETSATIGDFVRTAASLLVSGGSLYMVHRPDRLSDIITEFRGNMIEPKELQMVVPSSGQSANIVLIHGISGAGSGLKVLPEIAVRSSEGGYTEDILRIYERGTS